MLNKYIEKRITDKITILNILLDIRSIELDELSTLTSLQSKSLLSILQELQETFEEELTFNLDTQQVQLIEHHSHQTNYYFHQLYNQSTILKYSASFYYKVIKALTNLHKKSIFPSQQATAYDKSVACYYVQ